MPISPLAGKPAPAHLLIDVSALEQAYLSRHPDPSIPGQRVSFGTSGHRGTATNSTFNEAHILAIAQAICEYRAEQGIQGPLYVGMDSHALSHCAQQTALEVFAGNGVHAIVQAGGGFTPTPVISHAILGNNADPARPRADGVVITPSHNPPSDGGFKYNPPNGGPADTDVTSWMQDRANQILEARGEAVKRTANLSSIVSADLLTPYVEELGSVIDMEAIRAAGLRLGVDPLGGASHAYWQPIAERYRLNLTVVNKVIDPQFGFMSLDHDGKIRMDCSSSYAMAGLVRMKDSYDIAWANDPDADRHGIVTPSRGLLNPNHYLAVAIHFLIQNRPDWPQHASIGKTLVSSGIIDRVVTSLGRNVFEVPVGFKWFTPGLFDGTVVFGGEESAGASFLRRNGQPWSTDKDGLILGLLAAEITAVTGKDPGQHYAVLEEKFGTYHYTRIDAPASPEQKNAFQKLTPASVADTELAGSLITGRYTKASGNQAPIGGLKVVTEDGWFAARPSGTENIYKLYAESSKSEQHLQQLVAAAQQLVSRALAS